MQLEIKKIELDHEYRMKELEYNKCKNTMEIV